MSIHLDLQSATQASTPTKTDFEQWCQAGLASIAEDCELTIRLVDAEESAELNQNYRGKTGPTNVLSFPFEAPVQLEPRLLGDLVICAGKVADEALSQDKAVQDHWAHLTIHGCLHLLGYDHIEADEAAEMESLERRILASLDIADPYQLPEAAS